MSSHDSIRFRCPASDCRHQLKATTDRAGKKVRCPKCKNTFRIPDPAAENAPSARPIFKPISAWIDRIVQGRPRLRTALRWTVLASFTIHLALAPFVPSGPTVSDSELERYETDYQKKVRAAKVARTVSRSIKNKITMPPPPPDPEGLINKTLNDSLTSDIHKVVGDLLDVNITDKLAKQVAASLKEELAEAAKHIVGGGLSEEEIKQLHRKFKEKAHECAKTALRNHRIEDQVDNAKMSSTEWYEKQVSKTLLGNMRSVLFSSRYRLWRNQYYGGYSWGRRLNWNKLPTSNGHLQYKLRQLGLLAAGKDYKGRPIKDWSRPNMTVARYVHSNLNQLYKGTISKHRTYPTPSWRAVIYGEIDKHPMSGSTHETHMTDGLIREHYPHQGEAILKKAKELDGFWEQALTAANQFKEQADADEDLNAAQKACAAAIKTICRKAAPLVLSGRANDKSSPLGRRQAINNGLRLQMLAGPMRDEMYTCWEDAMVKGLSRLVQRFARGQFRRGIIVQKDGVKEAMEEFAERIVPLLRRDVTKIIPKKRFDEIVFAGGGDHYRTPLGEPTYIPRPADINKAVTAWSRVISEHPELKPYEEKRREALQNHFRDAINNVREQLLSRVLSGGLLMRRMDVFVEGVNYEDKVQEKLDARAAAMKGRGQDLANLTKEGVPDTSAPMVALMYGASKGHGASLQPVITGLVPGFRAPSLPATSMRFSRPAFPPRPSKWGLEEQAKVKPSFKTNRFEGIPFLARTPRIDGDLTDWGRVRPLILKAAKGKEPVIVYAAWNYQGFFFGYQVKQSEERYYYPTQWRVYWDNRSGTRDGQGVRISGTSWAFAGDHLKLLFDTLDARAPQRGEAHTQEFVIFPRGTDSDPAIPGIEQIFRSKRDATSKQWRKPKATGRVFLQQPSPEQGPDGTGPYRVSRFTKDGYTMEVFVPRSLFKVPVFAPGWHIGFDCAIATGYQSKGRFKGYTWSTGSSLTPNRWGDLLMLGTDALVVVQNTDANGTAASGIIPGHSYLLTVIDPDRNVSSATVDTVLVSAEATTGGKSAKAQDVEVFILKESGKNTGVFRGYINTQPGLGRQVQSVLEIGPGQDLRFGYVDFANAKGKRNVVMELKLPVVGAVLRRVAMATQ